MNQDNDQEKVKIEAINASNNDDEFNKINNLFEALRKKAANLLAEKSDYHGD